MKNARFGRGGMVGEGVLRWIFVLVIIIAAGVAVRVIIAKFAS